MGTERWQKIDQLLREALAQPQNRRSAFLREVCVEDQPAGNEVETLLAFHEKARSFLETPALESVREMFAVECGRSFVGLALGPYKIEAHLGTGGMGEVYLGQDERLDRKVAIKLLPSYLEEDELAKRRLIREARAVAKLDHPNICPVYEVAEEDGQLLLVMQHVEGETLSARIRRSRLDLDEALNVAQQIAGALAEAHSRGIVHRDVKPQNVMITPRGQVKVLDFGLAKVVRSSESEINELSHTADGRETSDHPQLSLSGLVMGTAPYMSPEQARGEIVDGRSDLFSLGVLLYESVVGTPPFCGSTLAEICSQVINLDPPPPSEINPDVPLKVDQIITKALAKDMESRYQSSTELLNDLTAARQNLTRKRDKYISDVRLTDDTVRVQSTQSADTVSARGPQTKSRRNNLSTKAALLSPMSLVTAGAAIVLGFIGMKSLVQSPASESPPTPAKRNRTLVNERITPGGGIVRVSLSPDGSAISYSLARQNASHIWIQQSTGGEPTRITSGVWQDRNPIWSSTGQQLAFISNRGGEPAFWTVDYSGGEPALLNTVPSGSVPVHWAKDGTIYYEVKSNLYSLDFTGGVTTQLTDFDPAGPSFRYFSVSPRGGQLAYQDSIEDRSQILVRGLTGGDPRRLTDSAGIDRYPSWLPDESGIAFTSNRTGTYQVYVATLDGRAPEQITVLNDDCEFISVLPDGRNLVYVSQKETANIFSVDLNTGLEVPRTSTFGRQFFPDISSDGKSIAYQVSESKVSENSEILTKSTDDDSQPIRLASGFDAKWAPSGKTLALLRVANRGKGELWALSTDSKNERLLATELHYGGQTGVPYDRLEHNYDWSPDASKIAYLSGKSGARNLWVVSGDGSNDTMTTSNFDQSLNVAFPYWAPAGDRIAYLLRSRTGPFRGKTSVCVVEQGTSRTVVELGAPLRLLGWSASGQKLFAALGEPGPNSLPQDVRLLAISVDQGEVEELEHVRDTYLHSIKLSRNGRSIALVSRQDGADNVYVVSTVGRGVRRATGNTESMIYYSALGWAPDSKTVFYTKLSSWSLVSMLENFR
jgi:serine/threonine protein kinase